MPTKTEIITCPICYRDGVIKEKEQGLIEGFFNFLSYNTNKEEICVKCDGTGKRMIKIED